MLLLQFCLLQESRKYSAYIFCILQATGSSHGYDGTDNPNLEDDDDDDHT
jgi:hypothetical protein